MTPSEKVIGQWPERLRDGAQPLEPLLPGMDTDYVIIRVQAAETSSVVRNIKKLAEDSAESLVTVVAVKQAKNRWQPRNSWTLTRSLFDWVLGHVRDVMVEDKQRVVSHQNMRDRRRQERAS